MAELADEAMESEFGTVAAWTEQAVRTLGPEYAVPAGCRGSGSESALRWLADGLQLRPGSRVLDDGAGVGGPAGWLAAERGVRAVCAEPMAEARALLAIDGVAGVNLSGLASADGEDEGAQVKAQVAVRIREEHGG